MGLGQIALNVGRASQGPTARIADIIEFVSSSWGLNFDGKQGRPKLFPAQNIILKAHYGLELDDKIKLPFWKDWRLEDQWQFTEKEYLKFLYDEGRCNIPEVDHSRRELVLAVGRRSGKTFLAAAISAYETYKLLLKGSPQRYYGLPPGNQIGIVSVATDKEQAGILFKEVSSHFRGCFAGETEVITDQGVKQIGSLVGMNPVILTRNGTWTSAPIRSFGVQPLYKLTLQRQGIEKTLYATGNHRWFARDARKAYRGGGFKEFTTLELRPGKHHLQATFGNSYKNRIDPSPFGVAHGFVFGDGCTTAGIRNAVTADLYGEKDSHLLPYFNMCPQRVGDTRKRDEPFVDENGRCHPRASVDSVQIGALPNFFRDLPPITENKAYLLGWAMGYFAADGCSSSSGVEITSVERKNVEFFRDVCVLLGIGTYDIREDHKISNITGSPFTSFKLKLMRGTLDESFFVLPSHKEAFTALGGDDVRRKVLSWTVKAVELSPRVEEVFCATVAGHGDFVLAGNIATGNCAFFAPYTANNTQSYARFQTPQDIQDTCPYGDDPGAARATLYVSFRSCIAKGLRGAGNLVVILDEEAHFTDAGQSSASDVYKAVAPSTATFSPKDPNDTGNAIGEVEGRIINISSPLGKQGQFYELFQTALKGGKAANTMLAIQAPTWEVNSSLPASEYEKHYLHDAIAFNTEFGAAFSDRTRGWIDRPQDFFQCIDPNHRPTVQAPARRPHFVGIDVGLVNDASAIAIGHLEIRDGVKVIVLDQVDKIKAGEGAHANKERLEFDDVVDWIYNYSRRFYFAHGIFDQWAGIPFEQALAKRGLRQMKSEHMTRNINSDIYRNFKDMVYDQRLVLFDWPIPQDSAVQHCAYIEELLELQAEVHTKYIIDVHAPEADGKHDDTSDALVRMVWLASQHLGTPKYIVGSHISSPMGFQPNPMNQTAIRRKLWAQARQTGTSPDRQRSRAAPGHIRGR